MKTLLPPPSQYNPHSYISLLGNLKKIRKITNNHTQLNQIFENLFKQYEKYFINGIEEVALNMIKYNLEKIHKIQIQGTKEWDFENFRYNTYLLKEEIEDQQNKKVGLTIPFYQYDFLNLKDNDNTIHPKYYKLFLKSYPASSLPSRNVCTQINLIKNANN